MPGTNCCLLVLNGSLQLLVIIFVGMTFGVKNKSIKYALLATINEHYLFIYLLQDLSLNSPKN